MKINTETKVKIHFNLENLKESLLKTLKTEKPVIFADLKTNDLVITASTITEEYPGADPHDAHYVDVFNGVDVSFTKHVKYDS